jgi:hypothetical protein
VAVSELLINGLEDRPSSLVHLHHHSVMIKNHKTKKATTEWVSCEMVVCSENGGHDNGNAEKTETGRVQVLDDSHGNTMSCRGWRVTAPWCDAAPSVNFTSILFQAGRGGDRLKP